MSIMSSCVFRWWISCGKLTLKLTSRHDLYLGWVRWSVSRRKLTQLHVNVFMRRCRHIRSGTGMKNFLFGILVVGLMWSAEALHFGSKSLRNARTMSQLNSSPTSSILVNGKMVTGSLLKSLELTNVEGKKVKVGTLTGNGKSVVVFLRHLG